MNRRHVAFIRWSASRRSSVQMRTAVLLPVLFLAVAASCGAQEERPALVPTADGAPPSTAIPAAAVASIGGLTDEPIAPGQVVHVLVFDAPDFSLTTRVSEHGDIAFPILGSVHVDGLDSEGASKLIADQLKQRDLMIDPHVTVTVDGYSSGITILGEVRAPGIYPAPGKHLLSDVIATAGGLTANSGRVIEISNTKNPSAKEEVPWDPTMRDTSSYDRPVQPGDRILVRSCGIAYIGGHVTRPGAYSLCGSPQITLSELVALSGGEMPLTAEKSTYLIRTQSDGTRTVQAVDIHKVLQATAADPVIHEDDIVYVTPSTIKDALNRAVNFAQALSSSLLYTFHP